MPWGDEELYRTSRGMSRNIVVSGRRTSMRLDSSLWLVLEEIARREGRSIPELCTQVDERRGEMSLTAGVRAGLVDYLWSALRAAEGKEQAKKFGE